MPRQEIEDRHELIQRVEEAEHAAIAAEGRRCFLGLALYHRRMVPGLFQDRSSIVRCAH